MGHLMIKLGFPQRVVLLFLTHILASFRCLMFDYMEGSYCCLTRFLLIGKELNKITKNSLIISTAYEIEFLHNFFVRGNCQFAPNITIANIRLVVMSLLEGMSKHVQYASV